MFSSLTTSLFPSSRSPPLSLFSQFPASQDQCACVSVFVCVRKSAVELIEPTETRRRLMAKNTLTVFLCVCVFVSYTVAIIQSFKLKQIITVKVCCFQKKKKPKNNNSPLHILLNKICFFPFRAFEKVPSAFMMITAI